MHLLIVEDETLLARRMEKLLKEIFSSAEIATTYTINETVQWLSSNQQPDIIFMDIELADGKSFEIFEKIPVKSPVIFTTAYDEYALKAFKVNSIDYLLKPIQKEDLEKAIAKLSGLRATQTENIYRLIEDVHDNKEAKFRNRILIRKGQKMISVTMDEVSLFFTRNNVTFLVAKNKQKYIVDYPLDEIEQSLDPKKFYRANRQNIISYDAITAVHQWFNGKLKVDINVPETEPIIVSRDKAPLLKEWLGE